jgi:hypothetical protein
MAATPKTLRNKSKDLVNKVKKSTHELKMSGPVGKHKAKRAVEIAESGSKKHAKKMSMKHSKEDLHEAAKHMKMHGG